MSRLISDDTWAILTIWGEARSEPHEGMVAVAEVIRNRTQRRYASTGTVASTCLWPHQFSMWNSGDHNRLLAAVAEDTFVLIRAARDAWLEAQGGSNCAQGAVLYFAPQSVAHTPGWAARAEWACTIGHHSFYRDDH